MTSKRVRFNLDLNEVFLLTYTYDRIPDTSNVHFQRRIAFMKELLEPVLQLKKLRIENEYARNQ